MIKSLSLKGTSSIFLGMSPAPRTIDAGANLMEAAYTMISQNKRRLTIIDSGKVIGIIRKQDLFFEIERILREL